MIHGDSAEDPILRSTVQQIQVGQEPAAGTVLIGRRSARVPHYAVWLRTVYTVHSHAVPSCDRSRIARLSRPFQVFGRKSSRQFYRRRIMSPARPSNSNEAGSGTSVTRTLSNKPKLRPDVLRDAKKSA